MTAQEYLEKIDDAILALNSECDGDEKRQAEIFLEVSNCNYLKNKMFVDGVYMEAK